MKRLFGLAALLCTAGAASAAPPPEPYFGHRGDTCPAPDTASPSIGGPAVEPSPVGPRIGKLIKRFEAAAAARRTTRAFIDPSRLADLTRSTCEAAVAKLGNSRRCRPTPLYLLGDGEIREEWLCGGRMVYMLFYTVGQGRITNLWAIDRHAIPPVIVAVPTSG
jgi:hypothetical protein